VHYHLARMDTDLTAAMAPPKVTALTTYRDPSPAHRDRRAQLLLSSWRSVAAQAKTERVHTVWACDCNAGEKETRA